jgi:hypothetical protein
MARYVTTISSTLPAEEAFAYMADFSNAGEWDPSVDEASRNNHHAFPASARHGLLRGQFDVSWWVIQALEKLGLVWDVRTPDAPQLERRRTAAPV